MPPGLLYFLASIGNLFLALFVVFRARRARGALPIALLCTSLFLWDIGEGFYERSGDKDWHYLRLIGSSMAPAFLWHFVLVFVHRERALRKSMIALYAATGLFTLSTAGAFVSAPLAAYVDGIAWNLTFLAVLFPFLVASFVLVFVRRKDVDSAVERNALNFVALGIAVGTLTGVADLTQVLRGVDETWKLGNVGSLISTVVLGIAILRHRLLEEQAPVRKFLFLLLLVASAGFVLAVLRSRLPGEGQTWLVVGAAAVITGLALYRLLFVRLAEQADRRKRLALIGTMAAGVAHEIKNPLAAIKGAAQFVQKELETAEFRGESRDYLKLLVGEVDRLNAVVESFLTYARPLEPRRQDVFLQTLLADILRLQAASFPPSIRLETSFDAELPPVPADPALLTNAVVNVVRNAVEVMPDGGTLSVRTRSVIAPIRTYVAIDVQDSGPGIPKDELERIFQPFYTTKAKGTGLGLAIALRIVEAHGGEIRVENALPRGCRFTFLLPVPSL
jgi:signal transduction histidine kinase